MFSIRNISRNRIPLFRNLSWEPGNDHWVISGPAGSGKTSLLEVLAGKVLPHEGEVHFDFIPETGDDHRFEARRERIIYIPAGEAQAFSQHDQYYQQRYYSLGDEQTLTVRQWLGLREEVGLGILPPHLGIGNLLDLEMARLSNGQLKKAMILKHLIGRRPRLLLWDYPFEGLDIQSRQDLCDFLDQLALSAGVQLVLVDQRHVLPACVTRRLLLSDMKITGEERVEPYREESISYRPSRNFERHGEPVVVMKDVSIQYGEKCIMEGINWTIRRGERWALTGPNGSGKTTLFSLIFADHPLAYSNEVWIYGKRRGTGDSIWDIKARMSYLGPEVMRFMSPQETMLTAREFLIQSVPEELMMEQASWFEVTEYLDRQLRKLSSGELQMITLMNCLLKDRELYLLDEPFQYLDDRALALVRNYMQSHLGSDKTLVLISHQNEELNGWTRERLDLGALGPG
ncbi:MAG: ATP-binding cassette domain-containing protein [Bacteroidetes bacterium]|nr:ATP-binding cassette domain-containing protein [Bacteroidota bacterium]